MKLADSHTHIKKDQQKKAIALAKSGLWQLVCATNPNDCQLAADLEKADQHIIASYGLHPWYAEDFSPDAMDQWLVKARIIGEIGLDSVWTSVPIELQLPAFIHQLKLAVDLQKTVLLHTKGAEGLILDYLKRYTPPRVIVHWYAGDEKFLDGYNELGCFFTLGPDIGINPKVQEVCKKAPINRILTETDGIEAVNWALDKNYSLDDIKDVLISILTYGAAIKGTTAEYMAEAVYDNFMRILG